MLRAAFLAVLFFGISGALIAQQTLSNDSISKLIKAGLSDDLIVSTVNASPGSYDTTANGIIALKKDGASDKVISAILLKASNNSTSSQGGTSSSSPTSTNSQVPPLEAAPSPIPPSSGLPRIFVKADQDFAVALTAALNKKRAPATVVLDEKSANYVLQSANVAAKQESGASKVARCLFAYCAGIEGTSSVSVQLVQVSDGSVVWAYQVRKGNGGPVGIQSLSEAVAKHLKNEFLDRRK